MSTVQEKLRSKQIGTYKPEELAERVLECLQIMEDASDRPTNGFRCRTGLYNVADFRGRPSSKTEDAITEWLSEMIPNSLAQVRGLVPGVIPDIVFAYERDEFSDDVLVVLEAKPVWQRWVSSGLTPYQGEVLDELGRATGTYLYKGLKLVEADREKAVVKYSDPRFRIMLLVLVFQRPGEVDQRVIDAVGPGWSLRSRHILDQCNPPGDDIGLTGMVFWPE